MTHRPADEFAIAGQPLLPVLQNCQSAHSRNIAPSTLSSISVMRRGGHIQSRRRCHLNSSSSEVMSPDLEHRLGEEQLDQFLRMTRGS